MNAHARAPLLIAASGKAIALEPVQADLAALLFEHPGSLPLADADALVAAARNLPTASGCLDLLLLSPAGDLTVVDCGGDVAAARARLSGLFRMNYALLTAAVTLAACSQAYQPDAFIRRLAPAEAVARNLERRRAALVVVGRNEAEVAAIPVADAEVRITVATLATFRTPAGETLLWPQARTL